VFIGQVCQRSPQLDNTDTSDASWADHATADVKGDLPVGDDFFEIDESHVRTIDPLVIVDETPMPPGGIATMDDGSTTKAAIRSSFFRGSGFWSAATCQASLCQCFITPIRRIRWQRNHAHDTSESLGRSFLLPTLRGTVASGYNAVFQSETDDFGGCFQSQLFHEPGTICGGRAVHYVHGPGTFLQFQS
jgi:hypothetical protein